MLPRHIKIFVYAVITVFFATIIAGFFAVGSPQNKRLRNVDDRRVQNLQMLQNEIINYWQVKNTLPQSLSHLNDVTRGVSVPKDPQTSAEYEYSIRGPLAFELCATFSLSTGGNTNGKTAPVPVGPYYGGQANWDHGAGKTCFERTIDEDFYKPIQQEVPPRKL